MSEAEKNPDLASLQCRWQFLRLLRQKWVEPGWQRVQAALGHGNLWCLIGAN